MSLRGKMSKKLIRPRIQNDTAEMRLRELQRAMPMEVSDLQDLRQPMLKMPRLDGKDEVFETFATCGTYQGPFKRR
jgi:hypothetical protein